MTDGLGVPANLMVAGFCVWAVVMLLGAVGKLPWFQKNGLASHGRSEVIKLASVAPPSPANVNGKGDGALAERIEGLCDDVHEIKETQKEHGKILGGVRERLSKLEGRTDATGPHRQAGTDE